MIIDIDPQENSDLDDTHDNAHNHEADDLCLRSSSSEPGFAADLDAVPRGIALRNELDNISSTASEYERLSYLSNPKDTFSRNRRSELSRRLSPLKKKLQNWKSSLEKEVTRKLSL